MLTQLAEWTRHGFLTRTNARHLPAPDTPRCPQSLTTAPAAKLRGIATRVQRVASLITVGVAGCHGAAQTKRGIHRAVA
jgi:hypothetical protein